MPTNPANITKPSSAANSSIRSSRPSAGTSTTSKVTRTSRRQEAPIEKSEIRNRKSEMSLLTSAATGQGLDARSASRILSRLMSWYFLRRSNVAQRDDFPKIVLKETRSLPIRPIDHSDHADKFRHDQMVKLVEQMLQLHKRLSAAKTPQENTSLERQIAATDTQIDRLVYDLYGLTEAEIKIVENQR